MAIIDFNQFGQELWRIADVFRDDTLKATEYLEEFSYFLFLKLFDDREREREKIEGDKFVSYLPESYRFYNWATAHHPDGMLPFVRKMFADLAVIKDHDGLDLSLFRKIFSNYTLRTRYEPTVRELVRRLLDFDLYGASYDVLGRAYEFVVQKLGEQKQYGQYFTPRHIVDMMVAMVDPKPGQKIYDPACGTGGFLVRAFEHVVKNYIAKETDAVKQEQMMRQLKNESLFGVEKAPDVFKLGLMNMILHGDGNTNLVEDDSLSVHAQEQRRGKYDVILTNPPFGPTAQERTAQFEYHIKRYEALFIQHIMNALAPGGVAAVVVPDGLLFDSKTAFDNIRRKLVEKFSVLGVVSLPTGVFLPYSGVSTSILIFRRPKPGESTTQDVWFYQVEHDGFELGQKRTPTPDLNDIPDVLAKWPNRDVSADWYGNGPDPGQPKSWVVNVEQIRQNGYNLTASRYNPNPPKQEEYETPEMLLAKLQELEMEIQDDLQQLEELLAGEEI